LAVEAETGGGDDCGPGYGREDPAVMVHEARRGWLRLPVCAVSLGGGRLGKPRSFPVLPGGARRPGRGSLGCEQHVLRARGGEVRSMCYCFTN